MRFTRITSTETVIHYIAGVLNRQLKSGKRVLWLVPGGSSIAIAAAVSHHLKAAGLDGLAVTLTDERYGPVDHPDSNWRQLAEAGFVLPGAKLVPVLTGAEQAATVERYAQLLDVVLTQADYALGFFGIGPDGHTAGILPGSPAVTATQLAAGYDAGLFQRVTMTPTAIARLDEAVVYAVGEAKWPVLEALEGKVPLEQQPAQALKQVKKLTIFNDHKGEKA